MPGSPPRPGFVSRMERFARVDSTQRVVREWLEAGVPEVCLAVADEQTAGRGRLDRRWIAPPGLGLLVSAGFRPRHLPARHSWRLGAVASLAMLEAIAALLPASAHRLGLKWPNDLVVHEGGGVRKVGGVLGEAAAVGDRVSSAVVGLGVNVDWPASAFPSGLADRMTSLRELAGDRPVDREALLGTWLERLERHAGALAGGEFPARAWTDVQVTAGAGVAVDVGDRVVSGRAVGTDPDSGGLVVVPRDGTAAVTVLVGEVVRCEVGEIERL